MPGPPFQLGVSAVEAELSPQTEAHALVSPPTTPLPIPVSPTAGRLEASFPREGAECRAAPRETGGGGDASGLPRQAKAQSGRGWVGAAVQQVRRNRCRSPTCSAVARSQGGPETQPLPAK